MEYFCEKEELFLYRSLYFINDISGQTIHFVFRLSEIKTFFHKFALYCSSCVEWSVHSGGAFHFRHNNHIVVTLYEIISKIIYKYCNKKRINPDT